MRDEANGIGGVLLEENKSIQLDGAVAHGHQRPIMLARRQPSHGEIELPEGLRILAAGQRDDTREKPARHEAGGGGAQRYRRRKTALERGLASFTRQRIWSPFARPKPWPIP